MGIYDRDYIQEGRGGFGLLSGGGSAVKTLLLINVAVFLLGWIGGRGVQELLIEWFAASSEGIFRGFRVWQLLTYAFIHFDLFHLLINMLFLWFAGRELEGIYGRRDFTALYLSAAVASGLIWAFIELFEPGAGAGRALGASGAVAAVIVIYAMYYPRREILLFFVLPIPMWLFVIIFLGMDLIQLGQRMQGQSTAAVAFAAHLGGAAYGALYKLYDLRWSRLSAGWSWGRRPRLRVFSPDRGRPSRRPSSGRADGGGKGGPSGSFADEALEAQVDEILAKIARVGRAGLTEEENRILEEASRRARDRRGEPLR